MKSLKLGREGVEYTNLCNSEDYKGGIAGMSLKCKCRFTSAPRWFTLEMLLVPYSKRPIYPFGLTKSSHVAKIPYKISCELERLEMR